MSNGILGLLEHRTTYFLTYLYKLCLRIYIPCLYKDKLERKKVLKSKTTIVEKKYLARYLPIIDVKPFNNDVENPKIIWICWLQGMENAPLIVKKCYESVKHFCKGYDIRIITKDNLAQYVTLPDYIWEKHKKGIISNTHFSDVVRASLLTNHGGIWLDSTLFLTAPLPKEITDTPFFAFNAQSHKHNDNWLLQSKAHHPLIENIYNLLLTYWKYENRLINYFVYHIMFDMMIDSNDGLRKMWKEKQVLFDLPCYELEKCLFKPFDETKFLQIKHITPIHKLTYKYKKEIFDGCLLDKILKNELSPNLEEK